MLFLSPHSGEHLGAIATLREKDNGAGLIQRGGYWWMGIEPDWTEGENEKEGFGQRQPCLPLVLFLIGDHGIFLAPSLMLKILPSNLYSLNQPQV